MPSFRTLLIICLTIVVASAIAFGGLLIRQGVSSAEAVVLTLSLLIAQLVPWTVAFIWISRRASDLHYLIKRTERVVEGEDDTFSGRRYTEDLDELLRASEDLRSTLARERSSLAEHRAAIDQLVESLGEGVLAIGPEGHVVFANSRFAQMFGAPERLAGRTVAEVVRRHSVIAALDRALHGKASVDRITVGAADKGRQIEIRAFPVSSSSEIAAAALFIDITAIERLQTIRSEFIEDFSHEVRTPLAGLRTAVETLESGGVTREHEYELRQVMLRQLTRLERLVKDLSELHRIESGELVLDRRPVDVRNVLSDLCKDFQERVAGQSVSFKLTGDEARANADPVRLQQVFSNLLDNAWKHGGEGEVLVEVGRDKGDAVVKISDEGEGIPPGESERIFNRFYRVDRSRSQKIPGGAGLGLAIAKHLVLLHGGVIRAYNRAGGGATFEVRLPTASE